MGFRTKRLKRFLDKNYQKIINKKIEIKLEKKFIKYALSLPKTYQKSYHPINFIGGTPLEINYSKLNGAFLNKMQVLQDENDEVYLTLKWEDISLCSLDFYTLFGFGEVYRSTVNKLKTYIKTKQS